MIATDHAPHSAEEKSKGLRDSMMGVVGLETAFASLYTGLVKTGVLSLERLVALMAENPRRRFGLPMENDFSVWDLDASYTVDPAEFASKGRFTPFEGMELFGKNQLTVMNGAIVYRANAEEAARATEQA
jgi:dihydroorotase